jgi:hypothetical protein
VAPQRANGAQLSSLGPTSDRLRVHAEHGGHLSRREEGFSFGWSRYHGAPLWCLRSELSALRSSVPLGPMVRNLKCPDSRKLQEIARCSLDHSRSTLDPAVENVH